MIKKITKKVAFLSDIHLPFEQTKLLNKTIEILKYEKPDIIVLGGDIIDFYTVSNWLIDKTSIQITQELNRIQEFLSNLRKAFPKKKMIYIEGNHEERLYKYVLKRADTFAPLLNYNLSVPSLLKLEKFKIFYINEPFKIGKLYYLHGHEKKTTGQVVHIALTLLRWLNRSFICGHFHKFQYFPQKEIDGNMKSGFVNGCLFDINKMPTPYEKINLQQYGFSIVYYFDDYFHITPIMFIPIKKDFIVFYNSSVEIF